MKKILKYISKNKTEILLLIITISIFKIAFYGISIDGWVSGDVDANISGGIDAEITRGRFY